MKLRVAFFLIIICLSVIVFSCRRNQPSLVDANRPPDTELWYSPPDSTEYEYLVHMYWRGVDFDGIPIRYIWTITDTLDLSQNVWNPAQRVRDLRSGRMTTRTDSVFAFTAFREVSGVGLKKNRQAFHVAAIDDNGVIDPFPAAIEFVATVDKLPEVRFATTITRREDGGPSTTETKAFNPASLDTVGMFRPFSISYHGLTTNGQVRAYKFFPLTANIFIDGEGIWSEDLSDTLRIFTNLGADTIASGEFRLAAQSRDDAGAESAVDAAGFTRGVCRIVVNFEPDTEIFKILNTYFKGDNAFVDSVDFRDEVPDTVPDNSWITLFYRGWDSPYDSSRCVDLVNKCLGYQVQYTRIAEIDGGASGSINSTIQWKPDDPEDNNPHGTTDSTTMNMGSQEYTIRVRAVDEYLKPDGTADEVVVLGNFEPTLKSFALESHDGSVAEDGGSLNWYWLSPANLVLPNDTIDFTAQPLPQVVKEFYFLIKGEGRDHPKENIDSGVRSWFYYFRDSSSGVLQRFARSGFWVDGLDTNVLADTVRMTVRYTMPVFEDSAAIYAYRNLPDYLDTMFDLTIQGRDAANSDEFEQFMFVDSVLTTINKYNSSTIGRLTELGTQSFILEMQPTAKP